jgi:predicted lipoprotein with Yx(FWY)xxD motif
MKKMIFCAMALLLALLTGCASTSGGAPAMMKEGMMVNAKGITLYTFDRGFRQRKIGLQR